MEKNGYSENIVYGVTVGKVFGNSIKKVNGDFSESIVKLVASLSPPDARVALFHLSTTLPLPLIHTIGTKKTEYYLTESDGAKLLAKMKKDKHEDLENNIETDSGVLEGPHQAEEAKPDGD